MSRTSDNLIEVKNMVITLFQLKKWTRIWKINYRLLSKSIVIEFKFRAPSELTESNVKIYDIYRKKHKKTFLKIWLNKFTKYY